MSMFSYNGILLPEISAEVLAEKPVCMIYSFYDSGGMMYGMAASTVPWYVDESAGTVNLTESSEFSVFMFYEGAWQNFGAQTGLGEFPTTESPWMKIEWTNTDITVGTEDGADVWLAAGEAKTPTTITWDMVNTEGLTSVAVSSTMNLYKFSDVVLTHDQLKTAYGYVTADGETLSEMYSLDSPPFGMMGLIGAFNDLIYVVPYDNFVLSGITFPEKGIYAGDAEYLGITAEAASATILVPEAIPVFEGSITTTLAEDAAEGDPASTAGFATVNIIGFSDGDILLVTFNGTEYVDTALGLYNLVYAGAITEDPSIDFTLRPYLIYAQPGVETASVMIATETAQTAQLKVVRYWDEPIDRSISAAISATELDVGGTAQITVTDNATDDGPTYTYGSSNAAVATVDYQGVVTAKAAGSANITAKADATLRYAESGTTTFAVTVAEEATELTARSLTAAVGSAALNVGDTTQISVTDNAAGDSPSYTYGSSNAAVATVSSAGVITAVGAGSATITITAPATTNYAAGSATVAVTVTVVELRNYNSIEEILAAGTTNMEVLRNNVKNDDNNDTVKGASWLTYLGNVISTIYVSGNSWFGFGSATEHLKVNRRDAAMWYLYREEAMLYNHYRFIKIRWGGYSAYGATDDASKLTYDVILWDTGDISVHIVDWPTSNNTGIYSLTAGTEYTYTLSAEKTDVSFNYNNDGTYSVTNEVIFLPPPYDMKYLVRSGSTLYTVTDGALSALDATELTVELFQTYGVDNLPDGSLLLGLTDPEVLFWQDSTEYDLPVLEATVVGLAPTPQVVITEAFDMSDGTILGIESAEVTASEDVLFALSFDDGATWKAYDGTTWITLETVNAGMTKATMENIGLEAWAEVVTSKLYRLRFTLMESTSYVTQVVIHYIN